MLVLTFIVVVALTIGFVVVFLMAVLHEGVPEDDDWFWGDDTPDDTPIVQPIQSTKEEDMATAQDLINKMDQLLGYKYDFGGELTGSSPGNCDCSEAVEWACRNLGVSPTMPDGSQNQFNHGDKNGQRISFAEARNTPGSLIFKSHTSAYPPADRNNNGIYHVAVIKGYNLTTEVCCSDGDKIVNKNIDGRSDWYLYGVRVPGISYSGGTTPPPTGSYPLPQDHWYGVKRNDDRNHSGYSPGEPAGTPGWGSNQYVTDQENIKKVQSKVGASADGLYGSGTSAAVQSFQAANGLTADGDVGPRTWDVMF